MSTSCHWGLPIQHSFPLVTDSLKQITGLCGDYHCCVCESTTPFTFLFLDPLKEVDRKVMEFNVLHQW